MAEPEASTSNTAEEGGEAPMSKKGLKKAEAAKKKAEEKAKKAAQQATLVVQAEDHAKDNYQEYTGQKLAGKKLLLQNIAEQDVGKVVNCRAFLHKKGRQQGAKMAFVELRSPRHGETFQYWSIQGVLAESDNVSRQMIKWATTLTAESYVAIEAVLQAAIEPIKSTKVTAYELIIKKIYLVSAAPGSLGLILATANKSPGQPASTLGGAAGTETAGNLKATLEVHLNNPAMHGRAELDLAIKIIRNNVKELFSQYLKGQDFMEFEPPATIAAASEGGSNVFEVKYFEEKAYLAQSPQFYKQLEIMKGRRRIFCISKVFRAEDSNTPRHMTEFTGLDLEMEIEEDYSEVLHMLESVLLHIFRGLEERCKDAIDYIRNEFPCEPFLLPEPGKEVCLTFAEGQKLLREECPSEWAHVQDDADMTTPQEKALGEVIRKKFNTDFYTLDKFPVGARPFYTKLDPENPKVTNAYDMFMRGQEILSGGQRIHDADQLEAHMRTKGVDPDKPGLKEYVQWFRSVGVPPHGGGGLGLDRIVAWYLNIPTVQLVTDYARTPSRLYP